MDPGRGKAVDHHGFADMVPQSLPWRSQKHYNERMLIQERVGELLLARNLTLATAESCTGGLVSHLVTNVPGSSAYFLGGVVSYAYDAKENLLGVDHDTLYGQGAVSEAVARQMARGARQALNADIGVSVTGIAGPGGAMPGKPVGLTWVAIAADGFERARQCLWDGNRLENKERSAQAALELVREYLEGLGRTDGSDRS
jgi:PncC family amidohydrolase